MSTANKEASPFVELRRLNFAFAKVTIGGQLINRLQHDPATADAMEDDDRVLRDVNLTLQSGQRLLVVGGNGAGKSTLLSILAGKHLTADDTALIFGRDSFRDTTLNALRTFVSADWGQRSVAFATHAMAYSADMAVEEMMTKLQSEHPERRQKLLKVLRIDPKWRLHRLSDGQRRRVQLFLALLRPSQLIVLDEVLGMLDIISRENVLAFLKEETETRQATVLLATHIFDGTDVWASHVLYIRRGTVGFYGPIQQCTDGGKIPMYKVVEHWLREELADDDRVECEAVGPSGEFDLGNAQNRAGGYADGRLGGVDVTTSF
ncbi:ATP-binding Cassette (ABC) Superfamily [Phytophthora infestans T30-4]|uniref:ATP-binding Cassette (ABC) Superfamily n=2 Tax=Phytophthora infestans TaxID=4787 RepID=D0NAA8_PHYIT|nr:ATP-binding Cassette (ABC) Superfamily [Phytophthora infestans T30-4]EEY54766.1 ATP-binding Cassette (ABC) Superfamily [Phytophthora infestans T30-4]KAF4041385.1 ABC transporter [Phytophthora infestans]KAF4129815.1 ABC transporter [Phytophthora infestans]|eukprot:XP_002903711.1 ATP-binding Cassette (ABC) Superfamily [Phytophthora infestans T30-4]